ncbi:FAD binding domain-containing protein [Desulfatitalea tepidiphila]|uniref:FAD binding domain-containing protein n=1 Tax=Desulfatitalea tepidiphila TaxID=1185843 RepID=UPI0009F9DB2B|nr:FAD binding domain-containing protein [Desulfatitalea tepidiphila]
MKIEFELNGKPICLDAPADRRAVDLLREDLGLTGTKEGCGTGECGACTILVDGRSRLSCLMLVPQLEGRKITTIEGLAPGEHLHPVQAAFVRHGAVQCGFCTPGMVLTAVDLLARHPEPRHDEVIEAVSGNLCRCTGYQKIVSAVMDAGNTPPMPCSRQEPAPDPPPNGLRNAGRPGGTTAGSPVWMPRTLEDLWPLLAQYPQARVFAGGTDLLVWRRNGKIDSPALIGLERIDALRGIAETPDTVRIGAATTHEALLADPLVSRHFPVLKQALRTLGSPHIRHVGTIGGNLATASPAGDTLPPLHVLDATVTVQSAEGTRHLPIASLITGPGQTALMPGEIISAVIIPKPAADARQHFEKVGLRQAMACAVASLAAVVTFDDTGGIDRARLAWGSVGPTVVRLPEVEAALCGGRLDQKTLDALRPLVSRHLSPISDVRAGADYRRRVAGNLLLRLADDRPTRQATADTVEQAS